MNQEKIYNNLNSNYTLREVQKYVKDMVEVRGFSDQEIEKTMLLLLEETGELAKAIRKSKTDIGIDPTRIQNYDTVESEVADVFFVLTTICNKLDIDLYSALKEKEGKNIKRNWKA